MIRGFRIHLGIPGQRPPSPHLTPFHLSHPATLSPSTPFASLLAREGDRIREHTHRAHDPVGPRLVNLVRDVQAAEASPAQSWRLKGKRGDGGAAQRERRECNRDRKKRGVVVVVGGVMRRRKSVQVGQARVASRDTCITKGKTCTSTHADER
jgi:hypothetical protein